MEIQEIKQRIKDYFVEIKEDKFTKVKTINCKHNIIWKGKELENKFMLTKNSYSNELKMGIDYRHKDEVDSIFFTFIYTNTDGGFPGMTNIKMYLILDDDKNIELSEGSGFDHTSQSNKVGDNYISVYIETAQLAVSMSDFIAIANAKKIEYSIRFGQGSIENTINQNDLILFKGFYNAAFDDEFETQTILDSIVPKSLQNELLSGFKDFCDTSRNVYIKTDISIEKFRFESSHKAPIILEENENVILAVYYDKHPVKRCDVLITNKRLYYYHISFFNIAKVESINLKGTLNFEVVKTKSGFDQLVEKNTSLKKTFFVNRIANEIFNILNTIVKSNNGY